jgi:hypothetical protein
MFCLARSNSAHFLREGVFLVSSSFLLKGETPPRHTGAPSFSLHLQIIALKARFFRIGTFNSRLGARYFALPRPWRSFHL